MFPPLKSQALTLSTRSHSGHRDLGGEDTGQGIGLECGVLGTDLGVNALRAQGWVPGGNVLSSPPAHVFWAPVWATCSAGLHGHLTVDLRGSDETHCPGRITEVPGLVGQPEVDGHDGHLQTVLVSCGFFNTLGDLKRQTFILHCSGGSGKDLSQACLLATGVAAILGLPWLKDASSLQSLPSFLLL